ncbi:hypothetical protein ERO13_D08G183000v2 [Gossypium hirsutum]|uniref:Uncharacterized protein n=1 Tax=Gossypium hirsutum TaxID=3635 RepID=A0A1U8HPF9_GOSHI|nr:uncharacterized protein LOC107886416 [Gossypium hirsutum]KAG4134882.1 hypothetical protein ERO13_D08G183000v2 [Gossypium hirsutum]KAG4134883.1 hypothetical protein ERO13_D08G183000v2 [Gossypium hirsutum]
MSASDDFSNSNSLLVNNSMPTKTATYYEQKAVFVTVYVEKPRRRASLKHIPSLHQIINQELIQHNHGGAGKGYNRRAELLHYSRRLRESARSSASRALQSKPVSSIDQQQPHSKKIRAVQRKATYSRTPACFDKWGILVPSVFRSLKNLLQSKKTENKRKDGSTSNNKIKAVMKSLQSQMQKKWRCFSKPNSRLHKNQHR